jgi:AcrR family transcriptional regulator
MAESPEYEARTRRRGAALEEAIRQAVLAELFESGYAALSMEAVAARAGTGKAPLYRRWSNKRDLVIDAIDQALPAENAPLVNTGSLRADLILLLGSMASVMRTGPGRAMNTLIEERHRHPELAESVIARIVEPRLARLRQAIQRAARRGEIPAPASVELIVRAGPAMVLQHELQFGQVPTDTEIADIVDVVILPALRAR